MSDSNALPANLEAILDGPALAPPAGITSNFDNPVLHNTEARIVLGICLAISSILFLIRMYGTWFVVKKPRLSDYVIIPTYILFVAFVAIVDAEVKLGYFVHQWDIRLRDLSPIVYLYLNSISLYAVTLMLIKAAILLEWLHIFVPTGTRNYFFWIGYSLLWINIAFYSAAIIVLNLTCFPREKYWNRLLPGKCTDDRPLDISSAIINFLVDLGILFLPQKVIWNLNMSSKKRIGVSAIFSLGVIAVATAGYRTVFTIVKSTSKDITWDYSLVGLLLAVEITCGFVVFCLPVCPKALSATGLPKLYSRLKSLSGKSSLKGSNNATKPVWPRQRESALHDNRRHDVENGSFVPLEQYGGYGSETRLGNHWGSVSGEEDFPGHH
ncbi:Uu.00g133620.m01.CDS01 [Anthostomella pinea]|uniref:Uu.00g133620.m01.CDS01 n=1 Tax=Anthostomella pinea TaxID=933095 RepID=A0AAI8VPQ8_9PEZI|nr:Uu.00g133620.m01.CDS01 [Anthostomella pinea]